MNTLPQDLTPKNKVIVITDTGPQNDWIPHTQSLGWDFIRRVSGNIQCRLNQKGEHGFKRQERHASSKPEYFSSGALVRTQ
ncbi:hypothetical protein [Budvicia aquatica]|uniref:hypothetical protein n=1 Tax=Budvicia aquatica TaxID=82979 RepID=UPI000FD90F34|nr:hypothetical protein [Budvicia aquatica]